jgi:hypothetical protein
MPLYLGQDEGGIGAAVGRQISTQAVTGAIGTQG